MTSTNRRSLCLALAATLACVAVPVAAQSYPSRPLRIIVPYEPGSAVDATSRLIAEGLSKRLGQSVIVENRTGGLGLIAMNGLLAAPADGYTLLADTPAVAINPSLHKDKVRYDPLKDLAPVAQMMSLPFAMAVHPDVPARTVREFVSLAKARPESLNVAPGGTSTRLAGELFALQTGIKLNAIPYQGASPATLAVLKNESQVIFLDAANLKQHIEAGTLRGLLMSGARRWQALPNVPTAREAGVPEFAVSTWFGLFARAGTPPDVVAKLNAEMRAVMTSSPEMGAYLQSRGAAPSSMTVPQFTTFFHREVSLWRDVVEKANIKIE